MQTHILGFPSVGKQRELKQALESFWNGNLSVDALHATCTELKKRHWQIQKDAGLDFVRYEGNAIYSLGVNTPKADELRYQYAEDVKMKVKAVQVNKDNTKLEAEIGDKDGAVRTLFFYTAKNIEDLKKLAETEIKKYKYTGYAGKITTFLQPFALPGMVAEIRDIKYAERQGRYEIRSTQVSLGTSGGRRVVEIGKTVSDGSANRTNN